MAGTIQIGSEKHKLHLSLLEKETETQPELKVPKRKVKNVEEVKPETETQPE